MKKLFLAGVAALFLATGTAQAVEWQCGPHYVSTMVLHTERLGPPYSIIAYPVYNRTREDVIKNKLPSGGDEELGLPSKGFRWGYAPHPEFRGQRLLTYRGKPCFQYLTVLPLPRPRSSEAP
jgi:hypothetical protein